MRKINEPLIAAGIAASLATAIAAYNWPEQPRGCLRRCVDAQAVCVDDPELQLKGICWMEYRKCDQKCRELIE